MVAFADTSALLKLYVVEPGSTWMADVVLPAGIAISELAIGEVGVSLSRRARDGLITEQVARNAWREFRRDLRTMVVSRLGRTALFGAGRIAARSPIVLRTLDAIHLQGATEIRNDARRLGQPPPLFISSDSRLLAAAAAHGFATDDPLNHR